MKAKKRHHMLQAAIDSYLHRWEEGDSEQINVMKRLWGKNYCHPTRISGADFHEDSSIIDVTFKGQDHVALYFVIDGKVSFQGFES